MKNHFYRLIISALIPVIAMMSFASCNMSEKTPVSAAQANAKEADAEIQSSQHNKKSTKEAERSENSIQDSPAPLTSDDSNIDVSDDENTESGNEPEIYPVEEERREMEESIDPKRLKVAKCLFEKIVSQKLTKKEACIKTELISQYPELPTGCESVALTMALNSLGFDLEKTDIAENYLQYGYSFIASYVGDPTTYDGAGIYPPGLTYCANKIISRRTNKYYALDTTGTKLSDLYKLIENGCPVVVWSTLYLNEPYFTDEHEIYSDHDYEWYTNEHCIVLYGYDTKKNTVRVCDSRAGDLEYNADWFERIHDETGRMSLSIIIT